MIGFIAICLVENKGAGASNINMILYLFLGAMVSNKSIYSSNKIGLTGKEKLKDDSSQ
jgi:hypothetical protein